MPSDEQLSGKACSYVQFLTVSIVMHKITFFNQYGF